MDISESDLLLGHEYRIKLPEDGYAIIRYADKNFQCFDEGRNSVLMQHQDLEYLIKRMNFRFYHKLDDKLEIDE